MIVVEVVVFALGAAAAAITLWSAMLTVVVPRAERSWLNETHFRLVRRAFEVFGKTVPSHSQDTVMARHAPVALMLLPLMWALHVILGFAAMFWALGTRGVANAAVLSGSSLTTLGFRQPEGMPSLVLSIGEATIGLGLMALLISYLPTMYAQFAERESVVSHLETRAGRPPRPAVMIPRMHAIGLLDKDDEMWSVWERWFINLEETHTTYPALVFFRSAYPGRSWVTSAGGVLDTASVIVSTVDVPFRSSTVIMIRTGFIALREVADFFDLDVATDPQPGDPISVTRADYDAVVASLEAAGVPLVADRDKAWRDFAGWRVNYDSALNALAKLISVPPSSWATDGAFDANGSSEASARFGRRPKQRPKR